MSFYWGKRTNTAYLGSRDGRSTDKGFFVQLVKVMEITNLAKNKL